MPSLREYGLLVALGLLTALVFQGYYFPGTPGQTTSQCDCRPDEADPVVNQFDPEKSETLFPALNSNYKGLFKTRTEIFKMNWCLANPDRCQDGTFPTEGHEAEFVRSYSKDYDADQNKTDEWYRCTTFRTLIAEIKGDNDRCCQTQYSFSIANGNDGILGPNGGNYIFPSYNLTYQYVYIGECYGGSDGACGISQVSGQCCQKKRPVTLLTQDKGTLSYAFLPFDVNSTCSCQNIC
ncbi:uncharacterized protein [Littorina saxatilis]|uniref:uncharacterized protein n=1 Tax=Littorina saxatilis TaxID=31220 RepID=UPI0038B534D5